MQAGRSHIPTPDGTGERSCVCVRAHMRQRYARVQFTKGLDRTSRCRVPWLDFLRCDVLNDEIAVAVQRERGHCTT